MLGISIKDYIGIGDKLQFSSLPENYFRATGQKLVDVSKPWFFDFNPYIVRDVEPDKTVEMWNFGEHGFRYEWPKVRTQNVYVSNAEIHAAVLGVKNPPLNRPRLYMHENFPMEKREKILFHVVGRSNGTLPDKVIDHVLTKYKNMSLYQIGLPTDIDIGIPKIETPDLWSLAKEISQARMLIGVDSGPSWIAACFPDVVTKKVRIHFPAGYPPAEEWVPLERENFHSHWDDRLFSIHNITENDIGFTQSFRRL